MQIRAASWSFYIVGRYLGRNDRRTFITYTVNEEKKLARKKKDTEHICTITSRFKSLRLRTSQANCRDLVVFRSYIMRVKKIAWKSGRGTEGEKWTRKYSCVSIIPRSSGNQIYSYNAKIREILRAFRIPIDIHDTSRPPAYVRIGMRIFFRCPRFSFGCVSFHALAKEKDGEREEGRKRGGVFTRPLVIANSPSLIIIVGTSKRLDKNNFSYHDRDPLDA